MTASAIIFPVERDSLLVESWLSGLRRTTGNRVYVNSVPRVQIPNSPPDIRQISHLPDVFSFIGICKTKEWLPHAPYGGDGSGCVNTRRRCEASSSEAAGSLNGKERFFHMNFVQTDVRHIKIVAFAGWGSDEWGYFVSKVQETIQNLQCNGQILSNPSWIIQKIHAFSPKLPYCYFASYRI